MRDGMEVQRKEQARQREGVNDSENEREGAVIGREKRMRKRKEITSKISQKG